MQLARAGSSSLSIPGSHDHHFVSLASDERRLAAITREDPGPAFRVPPAERVLRALCPDVEIITNHPVTTLEGVSFQHGHYIGPHVESFGWRMLDRLSWQLTGSQRPDRLSVTDYEASQAPLLELMYEMANLDIAPGSVCFAHTHTPLHGVPSTDDGARWRFYSSGSWMWDRRLRGHPQYRSTSWPGTVLRVCDGEIELVELLADCSERDLAAMLPLRAGVELTAGQGPTTRRRGRPAALRASP